MGKMQIVAQISTIYACVLDNVRVDSVQLKLNDLDVQAEHLWATELRHNDSLDPSDLAINHDPLIFGGTLTAQITYT